MNIWALLDRDNKVALWVTGIFLIPLIAYIDYLNPPAFELTVLYLFPIILLAWAGGRWGGYGASVVCAIITREVNLFPNDNSAVAYSYWNTGSKLLTYLVITSLLLSMKELLEKERLTARVDYLTGVLNRLAFFETTSTEVKRTRRNRHLFTLAYIDLDNFKNINDRHGHHVGDALLLSVAKTLRKCLRASDTIARMGGDEFAVLLPETDFQNAEIAVGKMREQLLREMSKREWPVTFSIGVLTLEEAPENVHELLKCADDLMYRAKHGGKNSIRHERYPLL